MFDGVFQRLPLLLLHDRVSRDVLARGSEALRKGRHSRRSKYPTIVYRTTAAQRPEGEGAQACCEVDPVCGTGRSLVAKRKALIDGRREGFVCEKCKGQ